MSPDFIDINGHMNIRHYLGHGAISADALCGEVGIDDEYRRTRRLGVFTVELHLRYMHERREGETFSVHPRLLARSDKSVHLLTYPLDRSNERLANTLEILAVHVDMDTRRAAPFPTDAAVRWDRLIDRSSDLAWPAAVCGAMGVRGGRCIRASGAIKQSHTHPSQPRTCGSTEWSSLLIRRGMRGTGACSARRQSAGRLEACRATPTQRCACPGRGDRRRINGDDHWAALPTAPRVGSNPVAIVVEHPPHRVEFSVRYAVCPCDVAPAVQTVADVEQAIPRSPSARPK